MSLRTLTKEEGLVHNHSIVNYFANIFFFSIVTTITDLRLKSINIDTTLNAHGR